MTGFYGGLLNVTDFYVRDSQSIIAPIFWPKDTFKTLKQKGINGNEGHFS